MAKQTNLYLGQSTLKGRVTQNSLSKEGFTSSFTAEIFDAFTGESRTLDATGPIILTFDPQNRRGEGIEEAIPDDWSESSGTYTFTNTLRGISLDAHDDAGAYANAKEWPVGTEFGITTSPQNQNYLKLLLAGTKAFANTMEFGASQNFRNTLNFVHTPAYLTCGSSPTTNAATWAAVTDGEFSIDIDGTTREITGIDFSNVGNNDQVASVLQSAIRTVTSGTEEVEWDGTRFIIRSGNTGSTSAITVTSTVAAPAGTDISGAGGTNFLDGDTGNGTVTNKNKGFLITAVVADVTERDALTGVVDGSEVYVTSTGKKYDRLAGSWVERESGGTFANASPTVAGKVAMLTTAEVKAGTDTEPDTGAEGVAPPSSIASAIQDGSWIYGASSAGSDTYAITPTPAITAYAAGQKFRVKVDVANTGAATLNVSGLGAKAIVTPSGAALATGDILANQIVELVYDGTSMMMVSPSSLLGGGVDAGANHTHGLISERTKTRETYPMAWGDTDTHTAVTITDIGSSWQIATPAANNQGGGIIIDAFSGGTKTSVHDQNPEFWVEVAFASNTAQDAFIGFVNSSFNSTDLEDSVMTLDHFGFIIQDGDIYYSVADGSTQNVTDTTINISANQQYEMRGEFDGTTVRLYLDGTEYGGGITTNVPNGTLEQMTVEIIADASAAAKTMYLKKTGMCEWDRI